MKDNCLTQEDLHSYFDGEVSLKVKTAIEDHLLSCRQCSFVARTIKSEIAFISEVIDMGLSIEISAESMQRNLKLSIDEPTKGNKVYGISNRLKDIFYFPRLFPPPLVSGLVEILGLAGLLYFISPEFTSYIPPVETYKKIGSVTEGKTGDLIIRRNPKTQRHKSQKKGKLINPLIQKIDSSAFYAHPFNERRAFFDNETTAYLEKAQILLRSFKNVAHPGRDELIISMYEYEKEKSRKLLRQNMVLRRYAEFDGNIPLKELLVGLEPILLDISNLSEQPSVDELFAIKERITDGKILSVLTIYGVQSGVSGVND